MSSQTDICNAALMKICVDVAIANISDRSKEAVTLRRSWDSCLRQTLALHAWPFATTFKQLALLAQDPMPGWEYRYAYPADCITALAVCDESGIRNTIQSVLQTTNNRATLSTGLHSFAKIHGDQSTSIATDLEDAYLIYVKYITDTERFTPAFEEVLACRLALEVAPSLAGSLGRAMKNDLLRDLDDSISIAVHNEYNESREPVPQNNAILASRN